MDQTRISVHAAQGARAVAHQPSDYVPSGAVKVGNVTLFAPYGAADAMEFYLSLAEAAHEMAVSMELRAQGEQGPVCAEAGV